MKRVNVISTLFVFVICIFIITGCFPSVDMESSATYDELDNLTSDYPLHIKDNDIEHLNIDAEIIIPPNFNTKQKISKSTAEYREWDRENIVSKISNGRQIEDQEYGENTSEDDLFYSYNFNDNSNLTFTTDSILYTTKMAVDFQYAYYFDSYQNYIYDNTLAELFTEKQIDGIDKNDALNSAKEIISLLNIDDVLGDPNIYSMDANTMNKFQNESGSTDKYGNQLDEWSEEQEAYLLIYPVLYQNLPSFKINALGENEMISSSNVYFIYGRNGIISFYVSGIFEIKTTELDSQVLSPLNAIENTKHFFDGIIMDSDLDILMMRLVYIKRNSFEDYNSLKIEPVWLIYGNYDTVSSESSHSKETLTNDEYIAIISAVTGENIPIQSIGR